MLVLSLVGCLGGTAWDGTWLLRYELPGTQSNDCEPDPDDPVLSGFDNNLLDVYTTADGDVSAISGGLILKGVYDRSNIQLEYAEGDDDYDLEIELNGVKDGKLVSGTVSSRYETYDPAYLCTGENDYTATRMDDTKSHLD